MSESSVNGPVMCALCTVTTELSRAATIGAALWSSKSIRGLRPVGALTECASTFVNCSVPRSASIRDRGPETSTFPSTEASKGCWPVPRSGLSPE